MNQIRFAPAGGCDRFHETYKSNVFLPEFLAENGLNGLEYQCGRGVNISEKSMEIIKEKCLVADIEVSLHAPYYISLSSVDPQKRINSVDYILKSAQAVKGLGGRRIVVHAGACSKMTREEAVKLASETLSLAQACLDANDLSDIIICPETLGKLNQLGTVEEVCTMCLIDERFLPCIDFGHINAMTNGSLAKGLRTYESILDEIENILGNERMKNMHIHFSKIEYTERGGEVRHLTFADETYGPFFEPLAEIIAKRNMTPFVVCESAGTQTDDAAYMQHIFNNALQKV